MRDLKIVTTTIASLVLAVLLGSAGCSEDQGYRAHEDRNRVAPSPRHDSAQDEDWGGELNGGPGYESGHYRNAHGD